MAKSDIEFKTMTGKVYYAFLLEPRKESTITKKVGNKTVSNIIPPAYETMFVPESKEDLEACRAAGMTIKKITSFQAEKGKPLEGLEGVEYINAKRSLVDRNGNKRKPLRVIDSAGNTIGTLRIKGKKASIGNGSTVKIKYIESVGQNAVGCFLVQAQLVDLIPYFPESSDVVPGGFVADADSIADDDSVASTADVSVPSDNSVTDDEEIWD